MNNGCKNTLKCEDCKNNKNSLFANLPIENRQLIEDNKLNCNYKKGDSIFKEGMIPTGLICLNSGKVKVFKEGVGREQIIRLVKPVELFGYRAVLSKENYNCSAIALEDSTVCHIDKDIVFKVLKDDENLALEIIKRLAFELGYTKNQIVNLTQKHVRGRLAESLLVLKNTYGIADNNGFLDVRFSRNDLANLANMTTSNASRTLSSFVDEKLVKLDGKKIKILNTSQLMRISNYG
ncbi:MAG: Crp/Fnr family transcriptional regulator [Bacteroidota bacterium]|nr:Crp/Fnr family transcriptional regulator [Bacteroidota bacterium]